MDAKTPFASAAETSQDEVKSVRQQKEAIASAKQRDSLYAERVRVYPKAVSGTFRRLKWRVLGVLLAVYY